MRAGACDLYNRTSRAIATTVVLPKYSQSEQVSRRSALLV